MNESIDITKVEDRKKLVETINVDIDEWCEQEFDDGHRKHLGASSIGHVCARKLWYDFRWVKKSDFSSAKKTAGQTLRLFQRGHREERWMIEYLEGIGCKFKATPETQIQIKEESLGGHFGGSLDNIGTLPPRYGIAEDILFEFKTSNLANFTKLKRNGVKNEQPVHWSQMCVYGFKMGLKCGLYLCVDKNSDELHMEFLELDHNHGRAMIDRAGAIITAKEPPAKHSKSEADFNCKWCNYKKVCHHGEPVDKNCRSCIHSTPSVKKTWTCDLATTDNNVIPNDVIPLGCVYHEGVKSE